MDDESEDGGDYVKLGDADLYSYNPETGEKTHIAEGNTVGVPYDEPETRREKVRRRFGRLRWWLPF